MSSGFFGRGGAAVPATPRTQKKAFKQAAWAKCFSIISPMLCHADSRLEQKSCCAFMPRERRVQREGEKNEAWWWRIRGRDGEESRAVLWCWHSVRCFQPRLIWSREMKKWTELIYSNQNWKEKQKRQVKCWARYFKKKLPCLSF